MPPSHARPAVRPGPDGVPLRPPPSEALNRLLRDLGPALQRGNRLALPAPREAEATSVGQLLAGGFPRGQLSEISGPASAGCTSLALELLQHTTRSGELAAVVDPGDAFDPPSAARAGVALERVLWVRPPDTAKALRCAERLLQTEGFPLVILDLVDSKQLVPPAAWLRLARGAAAHPSALVVLSRERLSGSHAAIALGLHPGRAHWSEDPPLFERLECGAKILRQRRGPPRECGTLRFAQAPLD
ncbi:MAG: hypothetical protein VCC68_08120 [Myxococcota bacterium]